MHADCLPHQVREAPPNTRTARQRSREALEAALALNAELYVELAFDASTGAHDLAGAHDLGNDEIAAATAYDSRHVALGWASRRLQVALVTDPTHSRLPVRERHVREAISRNRYVAPYDGPATVQRYQQLTRRKKKKTRWLLEHSIWAPRLQSGNSRDFFETPEAMRQLFIADWSVAVMA